MSKRLDIEQLKKDYIGQTFGWLTILDVFRDNKRYKLRCQCKCGNECVKGFGKVTSGHTKSCGCFKFTKDYSDKLKSVWHNKKDIIEARVQHYKQWCSDNPDKLKERADKRSKTYKDHPEILAKQLASRKKTFAEHPEIQTNINNKLKQLYEENPDKRKKLSDDMKQFYSNESNKQKISDSLKRFYKENPDAKEKISTRAKQWSEDNSTRILELGIHHSELLQNRRLSFINKSLQDNSVDFKVLTEVIHPSQLDSLLSGRIKSSDSVLIKCQLCYNFNTYTFNNVWRLSYSKFRSGRPPYCESCRLLLASSQPENAVQQFIASFYSGDCIRNSRNIISPLELDLYYPEKKIAIEFNGDYWHSELFKDKNYHYNKFVLCRDNDILLISIFENSWLNNKDCLLEYIKNTFNGLDSDISFDRNKMNNNYPSLSEYKSVNCYIPDFYTTREHIVYTCGYSVRPGWRLEDMKVVEE